MERSSTSFLAAERTVQNALSRRFLPWHKNMTAKQRTWLQHEEQCHSTTRHAAERSSGLFFAYA